MLSVVEVEHLQAVGIYWAYIMPPMRYHDAMLMALCEGCDADTYTFHLPTREMTITLDGVHCIL